MAFGHGITGIIVASIVALSSGVAFIICFREFVREIFLNSRQSLSGAQFDKSLRKNRNALLDDGTGFVVEDDLFNKLVQLRSDASLAKREWKDPISYLMTIAFLGIVAAAGFIAGVGHFV